jgi:hypothetical protein
MSRESEGQFKALGQSLKALRTRANESLAEASGAVEIDVRELASYELGDRCPSEDVLLLLISHFGAKDDEAVRLWEMAGYSTSKVPIAQMSNEIRPAAPADKPVLFTDIVDITVNNYGVVMNFMQNGGPNTSPIHVARVGMSQEHARSVMEILQATLSQAERHQNSNKQHPSGMSENRADG